MKDELFELMLSDVNTGVVAYRKSDGKQVVDAYGNPIYVNFSPDWKRNIISLLKDKMKYSDDIISTLGFKKVNIDSDRITESKADEDEEGFEDFKKELASSGSIKSQFDDIFYKSIYPGKGYKDYIDSNGEDLLTIINDAKEGNDFATFYLLNNAKQMIYYVFWKNFIGAKASGKVIQRRIANGDFNEFISLIFIAFSKAIKSFKPKVYKNGGVKIGNWAYWLGQYLKMDAIAYNRDKMNDPTESALRPDTMEQSEKSSATAWDKLTSDIATSNVDDDFLDSWEDFTRDPSLNEPVSRKIDIPKRKILADVFSQEKTIPEIAADLGVTKNTLYSAVNIGSLLKKYNINQDDLAKYLHNDPDVLINALRNNK